MSINNISPEKKIIACRRCAEKWCLPVYLLFLVGLGWLTYGNTFLVPFVFDDKPGITENPHIRMTRLTGEQIKKIAERHCAKRFVANFTFALNHYFHRYHLTGYHVVNLAIHIINGLLVFLLIRQTLQLLEKPLPGLPIFGAALWLVNPVHIQSVTYIVQRMNSLSTLFYLLALFLYIQGRLAVRRHQNRPAFLLFCSCLLAGLLSLGSKEIAVTLPLMLLVYEWYFFQDLRLSFWKKAMPWAIAAVLIISGLALVYLGVNPVERIAKAYAQQPFSMGERLLSQPRVICHYLSLLFLPLPERLNIIHHVTASTSLTVPPTTLLAILFLSLLLGTAILSARSHRLFSFAVIWFFVTILLESSFIGLAMMFEHRTYLPSVFLFIAAAAGLMRIKPSWLACSTLATLIIISGIWTWQRNSQWQNKIDFWQDAIEKDPQCIRPHNNLGIALAEAGRYREAIAACQQSIALSPPQVNTARPHNNIGRIYSQLGENDLGEEYCRRAIRLDPDFPVAHMNLGKIMLDQQRPEEAVFYLEKAVELAPHLLPAYLLLAEAYASISPDQSEKAIQICRQVLADNPEFLEARRMLGTLWLAAGEPAKALPHLQAVLREQPNHKAANLQAGIAWNRLGNPQSAIPYLRQVLSRFPNNARAHAELGLVLMALQRPLEAEKEFLKYLDLIDAESVQQSQISEPQGENGGANNKIKILPEIITVIPDSPRCLNRLAMILTQRRQYQEAETVLKRLAGLLPDVATVDYNLACLYARQGKTKKALSHLQQAVIKGFSDTKSLRSDPDLKILHEKEEYRSLLRNLP